MRGNNKSAVADGVSYLKDAAQSGPLFFGGEGH